MQAKISIIIPVYNAERYLKQTLDSVLQQTYTNWEMIAIDDCSKDASFTILNDYANKDKRIKVFKNEVNLKVARTRNKAIELATGEWIAFLDADDYWMPEKLEKQYNCVVENTCSLSYTGTKFIKDDGISADICFKVPNKVTYKDIIKQNKLTCSSVLVKAEIMKKYLFNENDALHEDYLAWLQILKDEQQCFGVVEPLTVYRLTEGSKSRNKIKVIKMTYKTYRTFGFNPISALWKTFINGINGLKKYKKEL